MHAKKARSPFLKLLSVMCAAAIAVTAILPSAIGSIIQALTPDLPMTADFEDGKSVINGEIDSKKVSGRNSESYNVFSTTEINGNKALKASVPSELKAPGKPGWGMVDWDANLWFVNNGSKFATLEAGKTYNIKLNYMVYKCDSKVSELDSKVGGWRNHLTVGYGTAGGSWGTYGDIVPSANKEFVLNSFDKPDLTSGFTDISGNTVKIGQWSQVSFDLTTVSGVNDYRLWICACTLTGTEICIDNITVTEKVEASEEIKVDFDKTTGGKSTLVEGDIAGSKVSGRSGQWNVFTLANETSKNKVLKASVPSALQGSGMSNWGMADWDANLWFVNDGVKFTELKAGKSYIVTLKYQLKSCTKNASELNKAVGGWRNNLMIGYGTAGDSWGTYGNIVPASTNTKILSNFEKSDIDSGFTDISGNTVEIGKWKTVKVEIVPAEGKNDYRLWICACALTGTELYIDDITVAEKKVGAADDGTIDFSSSKAYGEIDGEKIASYNDENGYNSFSVVGVDGNKVLKAETGANWKNATGNFSWHKDWGNSLWRVNDGNTFTKLEAEKTYTVSFRYMVASAAKMPDGMNNGWLNKLYIGYGNGGNDDWGNYGSFRPGTSFTVIDKYNANPEADKTLIYNGGKVADVNGNTVKVGEWVSFTTQITTAANAGDYKLWIGASLITGNVIYIDDIKVTEGGTAASPILGTVLDFEKDKDGRNSLSYGDIDGAIIAGYNDSGALNTFTVAKDVDNAENTVLKAQTGTKFTNGEQWGTWHRDWGNNLWRVNDGKQFVELEAEKTYTVSFKYKLVSVSAAADLSPNVGGWRNQLSIGYGTSNSDAYGNYGSISPLFTYRTAVLSNFDAKDIESGLFADSNGTAVTTGKWNTFKTTFTTAANVNDYRLWIQAGALTGTVFYIDDIKVEEGGVIADNIPVIGEDYPINFEYSEDGLNPKPYGQINGVAVASYNDSGSSKNAFSVTNESASSQNRVLTAKLAYGFNDPTDTWADWHYGWGRCMWIFNNGKKVVELEPGTVYKVSFRYRVNFAGAIPETQVGRRAGLMIGYGRGEEAWGEWGNYSVKANTQVQTVLSNFSETDLASGAVFKDANNTVVKLGEWNTYECLIPVVEGKENYELFFAFSAIMGTEMQFDDIVVVKTDMEVDTDVVDFESSYTEGHTKSTKADYTFNSAAFINKKGQVNHGEEIVFNPDGVRTGYSSLLIDSSKSFRADLFLRNAVKPDGWFTEPGDRYEITFWYKAGSGNPAGTVVETVQAPNSYRGWIEYESTDAGYYELPSCTAADGWKQGSIIFENRTNAKQYIVFQVNCGVADNSGSTIYFDDIAVRKLTDEQVYVVFDNRDGKNSSYKVGSVGDALVVPNPTREGYTFGGWYTDAALTKEFTKTTVPEKSQIVYAKWSINKGTVITEGFEDYSYFLPSNCSVTTEAAASGNKSLKFTRQAERPTEDYVYISFGKELVTVNPGQKYAVAFDYRIEVPPYSGEQQLNFYLKTSRSDGSNDLSFNQMFDSTKSGLWIPTHVRTGQWLQFSDIVEIEETENSYVITIKIGQGPSVVGYIDNISIAQVYDDQGVVLVNNDAGGNTPFYVGKRGTSVTLKNPKRIGDYLFKGFFSDSKLTNQVSSVEFKEEEQRIYAKWVITRFTEDFENYEGLPGAYCLGSDYELYNSSVSGFNPANVHGGATSLHRKGDKHVFQVAQVINSKYTLTANAMYTISFYVKMDSSLHKDGAVQIASALSYFTLSPSAISGEWQNVIAIEDLSDGEWHKVSYTFCSFGVGLFIRTPGYCSIYIDDVVFEYAGDDAKVSQQAKVKNEYVPALRNADGTLVNEKIIVTDPSLAKLEQTISNSKNDNTENGKGSIVLYTVIITVGVIVIAAAVTAAIIIVKKKRKTVK